MTCTARCNVSIDSWVVRRVSRIVLWGGLLAMLAQWGVFVRLTFWELSWSFPSSVADELQIGEEDCT